MVVGWVECVGCLFCGVVIGAHSSLVIFLLRKRELAAVSVPIHNNLIELYMLCMGTLIYADYF